MKRKIALLLAASMLVVSVCEAKGGFSSGGRGSFSSGRSYSSPSRPSVSSRSVTTTSRSYSSHVTTTNHYYGGMGMGYGYSNGLVTGMIIGNMMHPYGTVMYTGAGMYGNNALLYPNGQVVTQQGVLVGTYVNGVFTPVQNGGVVAQPIPQDAVQPQPVVIQDNSGLVIVLIFTFFGMFLLF